MFIRILRGQAYDGAATLAAVNRWRQELGAGVLGWQRLTAGIGDGGELVLALRYDTETAARRDRDRPELAAWQAAAERHLAGPGHWYDCPVVHTMKDGDAGEAGFVRVVQGRLADPVRLAAMRAEVERTLRDRAPHVLGVIVAEHADGTGFTELTYLTSEREARAADRQMPVEMAVQLGTVRSYVEALEEVELRRPVLASPAVPVG
ncbi:MAG TPA: hypothetical protein VJ931_11275 [Actinomycetota bacterium]|nr:hypothetical protein [Actinomycetota bacterium]